METAVITLLSIASIISGAVVDQLTPAVYVMNKGSSSIGPAIRIIENNPAPSAISNITVVLATSSVDLTQIHYRCIFEKCQDQRLSEANLLPHAIDLLALAHLVKTRENTVGPNNCPTVIFDYNYNDPSLSSYGEIERGQLPYDFGTGEFSFSFVATLTKQSFIFLVPNSTNRSLPVSEASTDFGLRIQKAFVRFSYQYVANDIIIRKEQIIGLRNTNVKKFFNGTPKHYTLVITVKPPQIAIYLDCEKLKTVNLRGGNPIRPNPNSNVFIKRSQPHTSSADREGGEFHGLYYYPMALNESQITQFCNCESEGFILPQVLADGVTAQVASNKRSIYLLGAPNIFISTTIAATLLRSINYTNKLDSFVAYPTRQLDFLITSRNGVNSLSTGTLALVNSDSSLPVIDLNGPNTPGINVSFTKISSPVLVSPQAVVTRNIEGFPSISPTISCVLVQLTNAVDNDYEQLTVTTTSQVLSVIAINNSQTLEIVGPGLPSEFNSVLQAILYVNMKENPTTSTRRVISFLVTDTEGRKSSQQATSTIKLLTSENNIQNNFKTEIIIIGITVPAVALVVIFFAVILIVFIKITSKSTKCARDVVPNNSAHEENSGCSAEHLENKHLYDYVGDDAVYVDVNSNQESVDDNTEYLPIISNDAPEEAVEGDYELASYKDVTIDDFEFSGSSFTATPKEAVKGVYELASYKDVIIDDIAFSGSSLGVFNISENAAHVSSEVENDSI